MNTIPTTLRALTLALFTAVLGGCMFGSLKSNLEDMDQHAEIRGEIFVADWDGSPVVVSLLKLAEVDGAPDHPFDMIELHGPEEYYFIVPPGSYRVVAFEDSNSDFEWTEGEAGGRAERVAAYNNFAPIELRASEQRGHVDIHVTDRRIRNVPAIADEELQGRSRQLGVVLPLDSDRFAPASGPRGLWSPMEFLDDPGAGLFFLEEYDPNKVPVLFVHGISGYPQEFTALIAGLDHERFQPWVFHYPSGLELGLITTGLQRALNGLRRRHQYDHMCLVAHSMGGVLSRLFLKRHREEEASYVRTFVTIDSPLGGMESAAMGVSSAPVVVPSWRNLDPRGNTIPVLFNTPLPDNTEYHLFFSHSDGETDGVVSLATQLRPEAMAEAVDMQGFSNTHGGVLRHADTSRHLNAALARCGEAPAAQAEAEAADTDAPDADAPPTAAAAEAAEAAE